MILLIILLIQILKIVHKQVGEMEWFTTLRIIFCYQKQVNFVFFNPIYTCTIFLQVPQIAHELGLEVGAWQDRIVHNFE